MPTRMAPQNVAILQDFEKATAWLSSRDVTALGHTAPAGFMRQAQQAGHLERRKRDGAKARGDDYEYRITVKGRARLEAAMAQADGGSRVKQDRTGSVLSVHVGAIGEQLLNGTAILVERESRIIQSLLRIRSELDDLLAEIQGDEQE